MTQPSVAVLICQTLSGKDFNAPVVTEPCSNKLPGLLILILVTYLCLTVEIGILYRFLWTICAMARPLLFSEYLLNNVFTAPFIQVLQEGNGMKQTLDMHENLMVYIGIKALM